MSDRIEEYRQDWVSADVPDRRVKGPRRGIPPRTRYFWPLVLVAACLLGIGIVVYDVHLKRLDWEKKMDDKVRQAETVLEMAVVARLIRQYHAANNRLPDDPVEYASANMKKNKPYPSGCDFWGKPYRLERQDRGFTLRSAGPNRNYGDRDDLLEHFQY